MSELNPEELNYYRTRRRQITDTHNLGQAQNVYQQGALGRGHERSVGNVAWQYGQMRERLPWGFGKRGLLNSGIYQNALRQLMEGAYTRPLNELAAQYQDQLGALQLAAQQLGQVQAGALDDVDKAEEARAATAAIANMLRGAGL